MTNLFRRLAARSIGTERQLRPQLSGLFEPQGADQDGLVEVNEERTRPAAAQQQAEWPQGAADHPPAAIPRPAGETAAATQHGGRTPQAAQVAENQAPPPGPAPETTAPPKTIEREILREQHETLRERVVTERRAPAVPPTPPPAETAPAAGPRPRSKDRPAAPPTVEGLPSSGNQPPSPTPPASRPLQAVVATPRRAALPEDRPEWPPKAERRVHIHIDHIEVRQQAAKPDSPPKRQRPANPAPRLDDYLRRGRS